MTAFSNEALDPQKAKDLVFVDKNGRIEILDASVLDLVSGGGVNVPHQALDNGVCSNGSCHHKAPE